MKLGGLQSHDTQDLRRAAQADCVKVAAVGDGLTQGIAEIMWTHGLANVIYEQPSRSAASRTIPQEAG